MATRGRKPKPTAIKVLEGNRSKVQLKEDDMKPEGVPVCPEWLDGVAKEEWERLAPQLITMGVLTSADTVAFAGYCQAYARWQEAEEHISADGATFVTPNGYIQQTPWVSIAHTNQKIMLQFSCEFGLTPSSRSRIIASTSKGDEVDEMEKLLTGV